MGNYIFLGLVIISFFGLSLLFKKAGQASWKGWIPFYNFYVLSTILNKPWWWCLIMIVPGVNLMMYGVYGFNTARAFNKPETKDLLYASILPYLFFVTAGLDKNAKFVGLEKYKKEPSPFVKNWLDPIIFAVIAASIIRTFFLEAFTIPTSSLEKSLMVGDFLFVNKLAYGAKTPQTPIAFPFAHHTLPLSTTTKSYLEWIKLPYFRLPGMGDVKNGDIVVFNYPDGDTVAVGFQDRSYYELVRQHGWQNINNPNYEIETSNGYGRVGKVIARPADKREHYVKRCVAIAGDKLEIKDGEVYINDKQQAMPEHAQHFYMVRTYGHPFNSIEQDPTTGRTTYPMDARILDKLDIYVGEAFLVGISQDSAVYMLNMPRHVADFVSKMQGVVSVKAQIEPKGSYAPNIFPHKSTYPWNNDNFGPMVIPAKGASIKIDTGNICLYEKILSTYDDGIHQIEKRNGQVFYDGSPISQYTFKQNYYWMMGDNRHNSADSRSWGFVPFDHVVGKPVFVWFSMKYAENNPISGQSAIKSLTKNSKEGKFRWERFLCYVGEKGLVSMKIPFFVIVIGLYLFSKWNSRRKSKKQVGTNVKK
jgi:signal peptidase I